MHYPSSENKGADQLRGYREADLRLCFCICKKLVFTRRGSYQDKHQQHTLTCSECPKKFTSRSGLQIHMKSHSDLPILHRCTSCQMSFATGGRLQRHMISHSDSSTFACNGCGANFKYKSSLKRHVQSHQPCMHLTSEIKN